MRIVLCVFLTTATASADLVTNGDFESGGLTTVSSLTSSGSITNGVWYARTSGSPQYSISNTTGPSGSATNALFGFEASTSATTVQEISAYQFIDVSALSGAYQLDFDYRRYRLNNVFTNPTGSINLTVYGITDDLTPGWTTSGGTSFNTSSAANGAGDDIPILNGATISELTFFGSSVLQDQWYSESRSFDVSSYDTVVIRLGSRIRLRARAGTNFDNLTLTAVPEPTGFLLALLATPILMRRKRLSRSTVAW